MQRTLIMRILLWALILSSGLEQWLPGEETPAAKRSPNIQRRENYANSLAAFSRGQTARVAFLGGSITEMNGYRPMMQTYLQKRFPWTQFDFINAGIASTCSTTGAFRLHRDVFSHGPVDLLFIEFAVNDDQDAGHTLSESRRGLEGILRQARTKYPRLDIVVIYFVNPKMLALLQHGETPVPIAAHEEVCRAYGVSSINVAQELADRIAAKTLSWKEYGGTHPKQPGNRLAANLCIALLEEGWNSVKTGKSKDHAIPDQVVDSGAYTQGQFVTPGLALRGPGWEYGIPDWTTIGGNLRSRFADRDLLFSSTPGSEITLDFQGKAIGLYLLAGPDAGQVRVRIDDEQPARTIELFHHFSRQLHYPRTVMIATDLEDSPHRLRLTVHAEHHPQSQGHAVRILEFAVDGDGLQGMPLHTLRTERNKLTRELARKPKNVDLYSRRGDLWFAEAAFAESVHDYRKMVELQPDLDRSHWRLGIAYFYAGEYAKAASQFERYHSFDNIDRENGIWRYLSQYRASGKEAARQGLLKYEKDDREPFPDLYRLFAGEIEPDEILQRITEAKLSDNERNKRLFYADLYIGLNDTVQGDLEAAREHLARAAANPWPAQAGYGPRYMWTVTRLHLNRLSDD